MLKQVIDNNPATNLKEIAAFESRHGLKLPQAYIEFLLNDNGGRPDPSAFPIKSFENNPFGMIKVFFGLNALVDTEDLEKVLVEECESLNVPRGILPIASTDCGDYVCIDLRKASETIVFWDRRPFWGENIWKDADLYSVAESFAELMTVMFEFKLPD